MGKGSQKRKCLITQEALDLQWNLLEGKISKEDYWKKRTELKNRKAWWKK